MTEKNGKKEKKGKKIMTFLLATNVVASRPPEQRPTGTATARANTILATHSETNMNEVVASSLDLAFKLGQG